MILASIYSFIWNSTTNDQYNNQYCKIYQVSINGVKSIDIDKPLLAIENRGFAFSYFYPQIVHQCSTLDKVSIFLQIFHGFTFLLHSSYVNAISQR